MQPKSNVSCWVGIDVSKQWVDVAVLVEEQRIEQRRFLRSPSALEEMAEQLVSYGPQAVVLEATGGLEQRVVVALLKAGLEVRRMNPKRVRDFARAEGLLAKTDAIDAYALALFGARMRPAAREWPEPERQRLSAWVRREQQIVGERARERVRLGQSEDPELRTSIRRIITYFTRELERLDRELAKWLVSCEWFEPQEALLRTAPGVGPKTARVLLAELPELGKLNRREIAALAGLAPFSCDSGQFRGKRRIRGGRAGVRAALYVASWTAIRISAELRAFYRRLVAAGKPKQLALIAVARKLLLALNEMMRTQHPWRPASSHAEA